MTLPSVPTGFVEVQSRQHLWWLKSGWEDMISRHVGFSPVVDSPQTSIIAGGRGTIQRLTLDKRGAVIVRHYRRGGFVRHFVRDLYWDRPLRPLAELACTEIARQRGVPIVEVLGAGVEFLTRSVYRGIFITREAEGFVNLWEWLRSNPGDTAREAVGTAVAQAIARMHEAGVAHADLNLTNILVRVAENKSEVLLVDFDRARMFPSPLPVQRREQNLQRLQRSLKKLDPGGFLVSPADLKAFCWAYRQFCSS